jgi:hypothetical protein
LEEPGISPDSGNGNKYRSMKRTIEIKRSIIEEEDDDKGYRESDDEAVHTFFLNYVL